MAQSIRALLNLPGDSARDYERLLIVEDDDVVSSQRMQLPRSLRFLIVSVFFGARWETQPQNSMLLRHSE